MKVKGAALGMFIAIGAKFNLHQECINLDKGSTVESVYNGYCLRQPLSRGGGGGSRGREQGASQSPPPPLAVSFPFNAIDL